MPHQASENDSSATSSDLFDLNLPEIGPGEGPIDHPEPTFDEQIAHAKMLLAWKNGRPADQPPRQNERFEM
jgi:hypothetical protein